MLVRICTVAAVVLASPIVTVAASESVEVDEDGRALIAQASQAYREDMRNRPIVVEKEFKSYVEAITKKLVPLNKAAPAGVQLGVTVLESRIPEIYSYVDGNIIITTGAVLCAANEAQIATLLSHEVAHVVEGHYIGMYQEIKAAERSQRRQAATGALLGALMDTTVDYMAEVETARQYDRLWKGDATYMGTARSVARVRGAKNAYFGMKDVVAGIPVKDEQGVWIDPRQRFEVVADAQGMVYLAMAGYDVSEASKAWENVRATKSKQSEEKDKALGAFATQMRQAESMMNLMSNRMRQSLGASGLVQTISDVPPSRPDLIAGFVNLKEVRDAQKSGEGTKGLEPFVAFLKGPILRKADKALEAESYPEAAFTYRSLYDKGIREARVSYGLAKSSLGDFAFSASEAQKKEAETLYREAAAKDRKYALPHRGLGELYEEWERYEDAAKAYQEYLKLAPNAADKAKVKRRVDVTKRKASR